MLYASPSDLARVTPGGWLELAQLGKCGPGVDGALFEAVAVGGDLGAWAPERVAEATAGLARIIEALERASRHADTYLVPRLGQRPAPDVVAGSDLPTVVATITLRRLYGYAATEEMRQATAWADRYLTDLAAGRASLGTPGAPDSDPETLFDFSPRHDAAAGYR